jgi:hypothetical protein
LRNDKDILISKVKARGKKNIISII